MRNPNNLIRKKANSAIDSGEVAVWFAKLMENTVENTLSLESMHASQHGDAPRRPVAVIADGEKKEQKDRKKDGKHLREVTVVGFSFV